MNLPQTNSNFRTRWLPSDATCAALAGGELSRRSAVWKNFAIRHADFLKKGTLDHGIDNRWVLVDFLIRNHTLYRRFRRAGSSHEGVADAVSTKAGRVIDWYRPPTRDRREWTHGHFQWTSQATPRMEMISGMLVTLLRRYPRGSIPDGTFRTPSNREELSLNQLT